jgi:hypothetical protein
VRYADDVLVDIVGPRRLAIRASEPRIGFAGDEVLDHFGFPIIEHSRTHPRQTLYEKAKGASIL